MNIKNASAELRDFLRHPQTQAFLRTLADEQSALGAGAFAVMADWAQDYGAELELPFPLAAMQLYGEFMDRHNRHQMAGRLRMWARDLLKQLAKLEA